MSVELDKLERLERLHAAGGLTAAEFATEKQRLLSPGHVGPKLWSGPSWRSVGIFIAAIFVIAATAITTLLLMPAPERDADSVANRVEAGSSGPDPAAAPWPVATADPAHIQTDNAATAAAPAEETYADPKPVRGRCLLQVNGKKYIDGSCDIVLEQDGSFDVQDRFGNPTYFAKVLRDGAAAQGYWNEEPGATHAHTDLGNLTRDGACWANDNVRICAWR